MLLTFCAELVNYVCWRCSVNLSVDWSFLFKSVGSGRDCRFAQFLIQMAHTYIVNWLLTWSLFMLAERNHWSGWQDYQNSEWRAGSPSRCCWYGLFLFRGDLGHRIFVELTHWESLLVWAVWNCCIAEVVVSPPYVFLPLVKSQLRPEFQVAAQNCWVKKGGAFTGEVRLVSNSLLAML